MKNDPNRATGEAMPTAKPEDPRLSLSFFRHATRAEMDAGTSGYVSWDVRSSGSYSTDVERGKAMAEEALTFMAAYPTIGNLHLISDMLRDLQRLGDETHRGLVIGFGLRLGGFATVGVTIAGSDAFRQMDKQEEAEFNAA